MQPSRSSLARVVICALAALAAAPARGDGERGCSDPSGPKCTAQLSTGITWRFLAVGPEDGEVVFLLHGYTDTSRSVSRVMAALHALRPDLRLIAPDQRGHGESSLPAGADCPASPASCFRPADFAADVLAFMDARGIRRASVVGHSMGSLVAQELGLDHPERVERLVLISTAAAGVNNPQLLGLLDGFILPVWPDAFAAAGIAWPDGAYALSPEAAVPGFDDFVAFGFVVSAIAPPAFLAQIVPETEATKTGTWLGALQDLAAADNTARLRRLRTPALVLWAVQDDVFSRDLEQTLIDALTAAARAGGSFWWKQYGVFPAPASGEQTDFSHNLVWEAPAGIALDIDSYLATGRPTRTLYRSNYPIDVTQVVAEPGRATLIHAGRSGQDDD